MLLSTFKSCYFKNYLAGIDGVCVWMALVLEKYFSCFLEANLTATDIQRDSMYYALEVVLYWTVNNILRCTFIICVCLFNVSYTNTDMLLLVHSIRAYQTEDNWKVFCHLLKENKFLLFAQ